MKSTLVASYGPAPRRLRNKEQGARTGDAADSWPSDLQIAFTWSGGFVGRDDRLDIRPDGAARLTTRNGVKRFQLTPAKLAELQRLVKDADLANVKPIKEPQGVADGFLFSIVYDGQARSPGATAARRRPRRSAASAASCPNLSS